MSDSSIIADTWRAILNGAPGARRGYPPLIEAAYRHPMVRQLFPFPTHGTLAFFRTPPASLPVGPGEELPFIVGGGPYRIYTPGYGRVLGEAATPDEAVALLAAHLPGSPAAANPAY
jgi:hypothetical protein